MLRRHYAFPNIYRKCARKGEKQFFFACLLVRANEDTSDGEGGRGVEEGRGWSLPSETKIEPDHRFLVAIILFQVYLIDDINDING